MADLVDFLSNLINLNTIASRILDQFVNDRTTFDNVDTLQKLKRKLFNTNDYINVYEQTDTIASKFPVERIVSSLRPWLPCCLHRLNLATLIIALHGDDLSLLEAFNFRHVRPWHPPAFPAVMEDAFVELRSFIYVRLVTEQEQEDNDDDASLDLGGIGERIFPDDSTYGMPSSSPTLNLLEKMERKQQSLHQSEDLDDLEAMVAKDDLLSQWRLCIEWDSISLSSAAYIPNLHNITILLNESKWIKAPPTTTPHSSQSYSIDEAIAKSRGTTESSPNLPAWSHQPFHLQSGNDGSHSYDALAADRKTNDQAKTSTTAAGTMVADHDHPAGENQSASRPIDDAMPEPRVGSPVPPVGQTDDSTSADDASESSDEFVDANDTLASLTPPVPASGTSFVERTPSITPAEPTLTAKDDTHVVEREDDHRPSPTLVSVSPKPAPVQPFSSMTHRLPTNADIVSAPPASEASSSGVLPPVAPLPPSISGVYETDWEPDDDAYLKYLHAKTHMPFAPPSEPASLPLAAYTSVPQPPRPTAIKHLQAALPSSSTDPITTAPAQGPPSSRRAATPPSEPGPSKKRRTLPNTFDDAHVFKKPPRAAVSVVAVSPPAPPRVPPHSLTLSQSDEDDLFAEAAREITRPHAKSTSSSKRPQEVGDLAGPKRRRMDSEGAAPTEQRSFSASLSTAKNTKASQSHPGLLSRVLHWHSQEDQPEASSSNAPPNQLPMVEGNLPPTERGRLATPSPPAKRNRAKKIKFTPLETQSLEDGMREFGTSWSEILKKYEDIFAPNQRTNVDLKDKARTEVKKRKTYNMSLGGFAAVDPK